MYKLIVFIPTDSLESFKNELFNSGAGKLGKYSHCSFESKGVGQFMPLNGSNPSLGKHNKVEKVQETRLEFLVELDLIEEVIKSLYKAHPYEEPAFDLIKLENDKFQHLKP